MVCICQYQSSSYPSCPPFTLGNYKFAFYICDSYFVNKLICNIFVIDCTYKWYIYFSLSDLLHSAWQSLGPSMLLQMALFHSLLWLSRIPLCICTTFFLIHSSVDGHFSCFHVLAILNNVAMIIEEHVSFSITVLSGYIQSQSLGQEDPL